MEYTLCLIFSHNMDELLLVRRSEDPYKGKLNGIGGKIDENETAEDAISRDICRKLRTNVFTSFEKLVTLTFPRDIVLHCFYAIIPGFVDSNKYEMPTDKGPVSWYDSHYWMDVNNHKLAGDGEIPYLIKLAMNIEGNKRKEK